MLTITTTNTILLDGLHESDEAVWREFDQRYRPVLEGFARKLGLPHEDARDAAQETLTQFVCDYRADKFDRSRGRLRSWLFGIARHRILDSRRARAGRREWRGDSLLAELPGGEDAQAVWEEEWRAALLRQAMRELRDGSKIDPRTIRAFECFAYENRPAAQVATELGMTVDEVYVAKSRVLQRLRRIIDELNETW